jgi:glycosyltransferase involved in cell wall biosynthesis
LTVRILVVVPDYPPGRCVGSWVMTHSLLRPFVDRNHRVDAILTARSGEPYMLDGVNIWPHARGRGPFSFVEDADVLVTHADGAERAMRLGEVWGVPVVRLVHNTSAVTESAVQRRPAALTVFNSRHTAEAFKERGGQSIVVRPLVDQADYGTTPGEHVTLINLSRDKGADIFYDLAERLPDLKFLGIEGGYGVQIIDDLPNVELVSHVPADRMRDEVYARTRVLLMPSAHESWGRTGTEAICSGIPVVAHPVAGLQESLGSAGIFVDRDDIDGWVTVVSQLTDGQRWRAASQKAKTRSAELAPDPDLALWTAEIERLGALHIQQRQQNARPMEVRS